MTTVPARDQGPAHPNRFRWLTALVLFVVVGVGAAVVGLVVNGDDEPASAGELSHVQASCGDWVNSSQGGGQSDDQWCTDMFTWMGDQSGGSMMGSMMWQGPEQMGQACREWVSQDRVETGASGEQRCNDMVEWMDGHMPSRDGSWMMQDR